MNTQIRKIVLGTIISLLAFNANAALINIYDSATALGSLADAQALIDVASAPDATVDNSNIWFSDVGTNPWNNGVGLPFPGGFQTTFVVEIFGLIDTDRYSRLYLGHDDGLQIAVEGTVLYANDGTSSWTTGEVALGMAGIQTFHGLFYENSGDADLFVWGYRRDSSYWEIAEVATVPEPAALSMFGIGLVGLGLTRRRRRTQAKQG